MNSQTRGAARTRVETLSVDEAGQLLQRGAYVGRVGFVLDGQPHIVPVNYLAERPDEVVFCSLEGTKLGALSGGLPVVFEVDDQRPLYHAGWSVIVRGTADEITDEHQLDRLRRGPLHSWAAPADCRWIRIRVEEITGRRIPED